MILRPILLTALLLGVATGASASAPEPAPTPAPATLSDADLAGLTAGEAPTIAASSQQTVTATSSGNSVNAQTIQSGEITLGQNAFSGFSGIGNFVVNSGANNVLQGTLSVTIVTTQ